MSITAYHWERLRMEIKQERVRCVAQAEKTPELFQRQHYRSMAETLGTVLAMMRSVEQAAPPAIEDILTDG